MLPASDQSIPRPANGGAKTIQLNHPTELPGFPNKWCIRSKTLKGVALNSSHHATLAPLNVDYLEKTSAAGKIPGAGEVPDT